MNDLEKMIMKEISSLDEMRLIDVLGFIRFMKMEKRSSKRTQWIEEWFEQALKSIHKRKAELGITPEDIELQIRKARERK